MPVRYFCFVGFLFNRPAAFEIIPQGVGQALFPLSRLFGLFLGYVWLLLFTTHKGLVAERGKLVKKLLFRGLP